MYSEKYMLSKSSYLNIDNLFLMQTDVKKHKTRNKKQNGLALIFRDTLLTLFLVSNSVFIRETCFRHVRNKCAVLLFRY